MKKSLVLIFLALGLGHQASAETIFKCVDDAGKITFTARANCPGGHALESSAQKVNVRPSGDDESVVMADPSRRSATVPQQQVVVAGKVPKRVVTDPNVEQAWSKTSTYRRGYVPPARVRIVEKTIRSSGRNKDGSTWGSATRVQVPIVE